MPKNFNLALDAIIEDSIVSHEIASCISEKRQIRLFVVTDIVSKKVIFRVSHSIEGDVEFDDILEAIDMFNIYD